jgi:DNA segregation ATPase FtsK/SpoIIIE-like protein
MHEDKPEYHFPSIDLLRTSKRGNVDGREEIALNRERLESTIHSFGVNATKRA